MLQVGKFTCIDTAFEFLVKWEVQPSRSSSMFSCIACVSQLKLYSRIVQIGGISAEVNIYKFACHGVHQCA